MARLKSSTPVYDDSTLCYLHIKIKETYSVAQIIAGLAYELDNITERERERERERVKVFIDSEKKNL